MNSTLSTISSTISTVSSRLVYNGTSIASISNSIYSRLTDINTNLLTLMGWLDPANGGSTNALLQKIVGALTYIGENSALGSWLADSWQLQSVNLPYLSNLTSLPTLEQSLTNYWTDSAGFNANQRKNNAHYLLVGSSANYSIPSVNGSFSREDVSVRWVEGSPLGNIALLLRYVNLTLTNSFLAENRNFNSTQTALNWGNLGNSTFTPSSSIDGIYKWFAAIQTPVARLSYVLANEQEIEARDSAAQNQQSVVDNFIDSSGNGSASTSDFGSIALASGSFESNFATGQSASGFWNVFNNSNFIYLSQEAADQLDTTTRNNRLLKSDNSYPTPALDKYYNDLYELIEVPIND